MIGEVGGPCRATYEVHSVGAWQGSPFTRNVLEYTLYLLLAVLDMAVRQL
jgi:hypothetical protein